MMKDHPRRDHRHRFDLGHRLGADLVEIIGGARHPIGPDVIRKQAVQGVDLIAPVAQRE